MIQTLIDKGFAYAPGNGDVYYRVGKFQGYGKLSRKRIEDLRIGARIERGLADDRQLERSGYAHDLERCARFAHCPLGPRDEPVRDLLVPRAGDDDDAEPRGIHSLSWFRCAFDAHR